MAMRSTWTDERMDDMAERVSEISRRMDAGFTELRAENHAIRGEMNTRFAALERRMDVLLGAIATGVVGVILSNLLS
jgi:hypothetical protein